MVPAGGFDRSDGDARVDGILNAILFFMVGLDVIRSTLTNLDGAGESIAIGTSMLAGSAHLREQVIAQPPSAAKRLAFDRQPGDRRVIPKLLFIIHSRWE